MSTPCDLNELSATTQPWGYLDPKTVLGIQVGLMCDALNGIDPTAELDPIALRQRLNCFARLSEAQLMGIWAVLWAQFLKIMATGGTSFQIVNYVTDPNVEGVVPPNPNIGALAYPWNNPVGGTIFQWIVSNQQWA